MTEAQSPRIALSLARVYEEAVEDPAIRTALERLPSPLKQFRLISPLTSAECELERYGTQLVELRSLLVNPPASLQHLERLILPRKFPLCEECSEGDGRTKLTAIK